MNHYRQKPLSDEFLHDIASRKRIHGAYITDTGAQLKILLQRVVRQLLNEREDRKKP